MGIATHQIKEVPELRFPSFSDAWEKKEIAQVLSIGSGRDYKWLSEGNVPVFGTGGLMTHVDKTLGNGASVFIGRKGTIDKPFYYDGPFWTVDTLFFTYDFKDVVPYFLFLLFQKINWEKYNEASGVPSLSKSTIEKIKIQLPGIAEQKKIAVFLSEVDYWIENLKKQKESLEQYKKGIMRKILSQKIRFRGEKGRNFPKWHTKRVGDLFRIKTKKNTNGVEEFVLTNSAVLGVISQQDYFDKDIANKENIQHYHVVDVGDFVYNPRISAAAPVGPMKRNNYRRGIMSPLYTVLEPLDKSTDYLEYYFASDLWHRYMHRIANYGARHDRMSIAQEDLLDMPIPMPCSEEREKIIAFMTLLDERLRAYAKRHEDALTWKRGLLQKMFV